MVLSSCLCKQKRKTWSAKVSFGLCLGRRRTNGVDDRKGPCITLSLFQATDDDGGDV